MIQARRRPDAGAASGAHPVESFTAILKQERARADRFGSFFCLVALALGRNAARRSWSGVFVEAVSRRLRTIDSFGWVDRTTLGVHLPATDLEGARTVATDIERIALGRGVALFYSISRYPADPSAEGSDGHERISTERGTPGSTPLSAMARLPGWKRVADILGSVVILAVTAPLMLLLAVYIKVVSPGPLLFRQQRVGRHGRLFTMLKFRTMKHGCSQELHQQHIVERMRAGGNLAKMDSAGDDRIIPGGRLVRKACLDELPQLFNVLRGEMSIVGPRPCLPYEAQVYERWHRERFDMLPGLTGLWQVNGKNRLTLTEMMRLDIAYSRGLSPWLDTKIALTTPLAILQYLGEAVANHVGGKPRAAQSELPATSEPVGAHAAPAAGPNARLRDDAPSARPLLA